MKTRFSKHLRSLSVLCLALAGTPGFGQAPVISSFGYNGELVCTNLEPGTVASVEWAPSLNGPWTNNWTGQESMVVGSNGAIRAKVPMYYRVRVGGANPGPTDGSSDLLRTVITNTPVMVAYNVNGELACEDLEPGTVAVVEWAP